MFFLVFCISIQRTDCVHVANACVRAGSCFFWCSAFRYRELTASMWQCLCYGWGRFFSRVLYFVRELTCDNVCVMAGVVFFSLVFCILLEN